MRAIGIDLGTTNSLISTIEDGHPVIIPNALGENLTPSVIGIDDDGSVLVGASAKERLISHPTQTISVFKRYMGSQRAFSLGSRDLKAVELSALVLKSLKEDAEAYLREEITNAVISVPAYFNDIQRRSVKIAGEIAGFSVDRVINEPTAAALAYNMHEGEEYCNYLILDLGGGTFDVTLLEKFESVIDIKGSSGDNSLGGENFLDALLNYFVKAQGIAVDKLSPKYMSILRRNVEAAKIKLTSEPEVILSFEDDDTKYEMKVGREKFAEICEQCLLRMQRPIANVLRDAEIAVSEIDGIILVGGSTRMHIIKSFVAKMFGKLPLTYFNPDEAIALGAAIQSKLKNEGGEGTSIILTDVCPYSLGVECLFGDEDQEAFSPIIERNSTVPISIVKRYFKISEDQTHIKFEIYQGESVDVSKNIYLGEIDIEVPIGKPKEYPADVRFTYDINGILEVDIEVRSINLKKSLLIEQAPGSLTKAEVKRILNSMKDLKIHPRDQAENRNIVAKLERLYEESLSDRRDIIRDRLGKYNSVLEAQNPGDIKKENIKIQEWLKNLEESLFVF